MCGEGDEGDRQGIIDGVCASNTMGTTMGKRSIGVS